jgi:hypothetical protein
MKTKTVAVILTICKGFMVPLVLALLCTMVTYPLGVTDCHYYGKARGIDTKYVWFECYIKSDRSGWLTHDEYERSVIGSRVVLAHG